MKKYLVALLPLLGCGTAALADETEGAERWDGIYVGANVGGSWLKGDMTAYTPYNSYNGFAVTDLDDSALSGGLQIGYNHQFGALGLGAEAQFSASGMKKTSTSNAPGTQFWREANFTASVGPRVSVAMPSVIFYGKGGLAIGNFTVGHNQNGTLLEAKDTQFGYMLGAGAEYALTSHISAGVQYDYMNFGDATTHLVSPGSDIELQQGGKVHSVRAVVNYRF